MQDLSKIDPKANIIIKGAKLHNLKNIDVVIPRNKLVVITGLSGSGKSTLAFDTLYAEGQRRYVESLSAYVRQFLGKIDKPKVDYIKGISPAIAIEQKVNSTNPRSTVGTSSEIYDYLKLLYARVGNTYSPISGKQVKKHNVSDVVNFIMTHPESKRLLLLTSIPIPEGKSAGQIVEVLKQKGFARVKHGDKVLRIDEAKFDAKDTAISLVVDRISIKTNEEDFRNRLSDAVETAFFEGNGYCQIEDADTKEIAVFSNRFECDGITFLEPNVHLFSFNNPYGACPKCEGFGQTLGIDEDLVIPNANLSVYEGAISPWSSNFGKNLSDFINNAYKFDFPIHKPWAKLSTEEKALIWSGNSYFKGLNDFFAKAEAKTYKIQNRVLLSKYRGRSLCPICKGKRLRKEAENIKINDKAITDLVDLPIYQALEFFNTISLLPHEAKIAKRLLQEIISRLQFLVNVGLGYLTLNRNSNSLSGGESQRINLATSLSSSLVGSMYILDEPSIGLHSKDTERLIIVLKSLRDLGNTVIVVEHDEDIMKSADIIIDIGPEAGSKGGEVVAQGSYKDILKSNALTGKYLSQSMAIELPKVRRQSKNYITLFGASAHNLKNIDVKFPLDMLTVVTGVSGSGKSTLVKNLLYPALQKKFGVFQGKTGRFTELKGVYDHIKSIEFIDQNPIGRSSRSNPVTYIKAYDDIRNLFAGDSLARARGYMPKDFSFNVDGGRCPVCRGEGEVTVEMQFMADVHLLCEACEGKRFKKEILQVAFQGKNISDILSMTIDDAIDFFSSHKQNKVSSKLQCLKDVGMGYVTLGQSSSTLSGGEAQRIKLSSFLIKGDAGRQKLFIFDEPTTGLHFHDVKKLITSFGLLIASGHSIIVVEHNLDLIKCADYVIDLGPEGGEKGGYIVAQGTPEEIAENKNSVTGSYLKSKLEGRK